MDKKIILDHIRHIAKTNGGKAPGVAAFERETAIANRDWFPHFWIRWGDALVGAGYLPSQLQSARSREFVVEKYIEPIRELGRVPVRGELLRKAKEDKTFPSQKVFYRDGKEQLLEQVMRHCENHSDHEDVMAICRASVNRFPNEHGCIASRRLRCCCSCSYSP